MEQEYHNTAEAIYELGWMFENSLGVGKDLETAKSWYGKTVTYNFKEAPAALNRIS